MGMVRDNSGIALPVLIRIALQIPTLKFSTSTDYYGFLDADESAWYGSQQQGVIKSVVQLGIMNGYTDGTFHPIGNITLSEAIKMAAVVHATCNNQTISFFSIRWW